MTRCCLRRPLQNETKIIPGAKAVAEALWNRTDSTHLSIGKSIRLDQKDGALALAAALSTMTRLKMLSLRVGGGVGNKPPPRWCVLRDPGAVAVVASLAHLPDLTMLDLSGNRITNKGLKAIALLLKNAPQLRDLRLDDNYIRDNGIRALLRQLEKETSPPLVRLDVSYNFLTNEGAAHLASFLAQDPALEALWLGRNPAITDVGATAIAKSLRTNSHLTDLVLANNHITNAGAAALISSLTTSKTLALLELEENPQIDREILTKLDQTLSFQTRKTKGDTVEERKQSFVSSNNELNRRAMALVESVLAKARQSSPNEKSKEIEGELTPGGSRWGETKVRREIRQDRWESIFDGFDSSPKTMAVTATKAIRQQRMLHSSDAHHEGVVFVSPNTTGALNGIIVASSVTLIVSAIAWVVSYLALWLWRRGCRKRTRTYSRVRFD